jgi:lipopolysaccharide biosynthesis glycosyltransferase
MCDINIGFALDINYVNILINCIYSITEYNKENNIEYYIIVDSLETKEEIVEKIKIIENQLKISYKIFEEEDKLFYETNTRTIGELRQDINVIHYGQVLFNKYFNIQKILYLEADQVILGDLKELYSLDIAESGIAANPIMYNNYHIQIKENNIVNFEGIEYNDNIFYFNAGVTLIDFNYFEKHKILEEFNNIVIQNKNAIENLYLFYTQGILNILFYNKYTHFDKKYNYVLSDAWNDVNNTELKDMIILHYNGGRIFNTYRYTDYTDEELVNKLINIQTISKNIYKLYDIMHVTRKMIHPILGPYITKSAPDPTQDNSINKCAFVVPLHSKHFDYGYYIYDTLFDSNADLYFIFTDKNDKDLFLLKITNHINFLILSDFVEIEAVQKTISFVSIKKLFALSVLYEKYDYISCIDSEVKFINNTLPIDYYDIMSKIVESKIICCGILSESSSDQTIVRDSLVTLTDEIYHVELKEISHNFRAYTWRCNLPVYDCRIAAQFLNWINFNNNNFDNFSFSVVDHITYNFFCILLHNYELKVIYNYVNSIEFSTSKLVEYVDKNITKLRWVNNLAYAENKTYYENNNFIIVYHLDRWPNIHPTLTYKYR